MRKKKSVALWLGSRFKQPHPHPGGMFRIRRLSAPFCWYEDKEGSCELIMYKLTKSKCMLRVREEDVEG